MRAVDVYVSALTSAPSSISFSITLGFELFATAFIKTVRPVFVA